MQDEQLEKVLASLTEGLMRHREKIDALILGIKEINPELYELYEKNLKEVSEPDDIHKTIQFYVSGFLNAKKDQ